MAEVLGSLFVRVRSLRINRGITSLVGVELSSCARAAASSCTQHQDKYIGESARIIREMFGYAQLGPL